MITFKCRFPEDVPKDFRVATVSPVWRTLGLPVLCIGYCLYLACLPVTDAVRYSLIGIAILGTICGGLQLWARSVLGYGKSPHYPNVSKTADVFCTVDGSGLHFSSPDPSVVYLPEVSWDEIKGYRLIGSTLFLTSDLWSVVLVALDIDGHTLEEWRDLVELMKAGNVKEI